jgi:MFS transporter, CP family, cyanate transporter
VIGPQVPDGTGAPGSTVRVVRAPVLLAAVLLIAANLRAVLAVVGPLLPDIAGHLGLTPTEQGVLVAMPVAAFAGCSPLVPALAARWGTERVLLGSLALLGASVLLRSAPTNHSAALWLGTAMIGAAIAPCNVLLPVLVRTGFPERGAAVSGFYLGVQSAVAAVASALAVPLAVWTGSWRLALAAWSVLVIAAVVAWRPRLVTGVDLPRQARSGHRAVPVWSSPLAWHVSGYFGLQASCFYLFMGWLPSVEQDMGIAPGSAGAHLAILLVIGVAATVTVPPILDRQRDHRVVAAAAPATLLIATGGLAAAPSIAAAWVAIIGICLTGTMVLSLVLINERSSPEVTGRLSSMVQGTGYAMVVAALIIAGSVRDIAGPGRHVLGLVAVLAVGLLFLAPFAGRDRRLTRPRTAT